MDVSRTKHLLEILFSFNIALTNGRRKYLEAALLLLLGEKRGERHFLNREEKRKEEERKKEKQRRLSFTVMRV